MNGLGAKDLVEDGRALGFQQKGLGLRLRSASSKGHIRQRSSIDVLLPVRNVGARPVIKKTKFLTIPEGLDLVTDEPGLIIRKTWLNWTIVPLALFAVLWDGFLVFWYSHAVGKPEVPLMMIIFPLGHVAVGFCITYFVLASLVNKTDIIIRPSYIEIINGPAPWIGNKRVSLEEVADVIVRKRSVTEGPALYSVMYVDPSQRERTLVPWITREDQAGYIASLIRNTIGIGAADA